MKRIGICASMLVPLMLAGCKERQAASIGIIGGADGPTAIFVTTSVNWWAIAAAGMVIAIVVVGIIFFVKHQKKL